MSTRLLVDEEGVAAGDWPDEPAPCGEAVPDDESFFFASLLPSRSFARESWLTRCRKPFIVTLVQWDGAESEPVLSCEQQGNRPGPCDAGAG